MRFWVLLLLCSCATHKAPPPPKPPVAPDADKVPFGPDERAGELSFLRDVLRDSYSHLDTKKQQWGVDLDERFAHYEPMIRQADTWDRYERVMVAFVSEFHDAHLAWRRTRGVAEKKRRIVRVGIETRFVGDQLIISDVWPGSGAERAGLHIGDRILAMDGHTVEEGIERLSRLRSWSRTEDAWYDYAEEWPARRVDADAPPPDRPITREKPDGGEEQLQIAPETKPRADQKKAAITLDRKDAVAVLTVRSLAGRTSAMENQMNDAARDIFRDPKGLVIDLRGNNGGYDVGANIVASRLVAQPVEGAQIRVRLSKLARERKQWKDMVEDPAMPGWSLPQPVRSEAKADVAYPVRMAVLVDAGCRSSCEALAMLLRAAGARLFGERTGGSSGAPVRVILPKSGARVTVPAWAMFDLSGNPIEGRGVGPDEEIAPSRADIAARKDPVMERAVAWAAAR